GMQTPLRQIILENRGSGIARNLRIRLEAIAPAAVSEVILGPPTQPFDVAANSRSNIVVSMRPEATGTRSVRLIIYDEEDWADTVLLCVDGLEPGIRTNFPAFDF